MEQWFVLILSGMFAYWLLGHSVRRSNTSRWLLWAILMAPPTITFASVQITKTTPPLVAIAMLWVVCAMLYWRLTQPLPTVAEANAIAPLPPKEPLRSISVEDEVLLRECFPWSVYFLESIEYRPQGVVCRGKLRTDAGAAYQTVKENITERFADKFFVLFQSGLTDRPFFVLVPDAIGQDKYKKPRFANYLLAASSWALAWVTTSQMGAILGGSTLKQIQQNPALAQHGWFYALVVLAVLGSKDIVKFWLCRWRRIATGLLYCIPLPFFPGTCGTLLQLYSPIPDRRTLFDLGFGSLLTNLVVATSALFWGLQHSTVVALSDESGILNFLSCNPRFSLFLTGLSKLALGSNLGAEMAIKLHPVATAAYLGFLMMAINMLPFKRFDGGYVVHAMYGVRGSIAVGQITKILLVVLGVVQQRITGQNGCLVFAVLLLLFPTLSDPTLNDVAEIDSRRDWLGLMLLAIMVLIFLPVTGIFGKLLGV
jgi:membrane-associated protease RseP (regulator of RpoE activity)